MGAGKSELVIPTYRAAYTGYMVDQNEPSKPKLVELLRGSLCEELLQMWSSLFEDDDGNLIPELRREEDWGDVAVSDGDVALYVTFHDDDRESALKELGIEP